MAKETRNFCPARNIAAGGGGSDYDETTCIFDKCQWWLDWDDKGTGDTNTKLTGQCAVLSIAQSLKRLADYHIEGK